MRAGSLSDERAVALLIDRFIPVHVPELCTKDLIEDRADVALLEEYHAELKARGSKGLHGGVLEMFLSPDGVVLDAFSVLYGTKPAPAADAAGDDPPAEVRTTQYERAGREDADGLIVDWLERARRCLLRVDGSVPEAFESFADGTAPQVRAIAKATPPAPALPAGEVGLRIWSRNSWNMYDTLVGCELLALDEEQQRALVPAPEVGARRRWSDAMFVAVGKRMAPRGLAHTRLADESVSGFIETEVIEVDAHVLRCRLRGELKLAPGQLAEVSPRTEAASLYTSTMQLEGELLVARRPARITSLRMVSRGERFAIERRDGTGDARWPDQRHRVAVEWIRD